MAVSGETKVALSLTHAPTTSGTHPAGIGALAFETKRSFTATTGLISQSLTAVAFAALGGISATIGPVKAATFLYLQTDVRCDVRITQLTEGGGSSTRVIESVKGMMVIEVDSAEAITLVEVQGGLPSGAVTVEWFACGT